MFYFKMSAEALLPMTIKGLIFFYCVLYQIWFWYLYFQIDKLIIKV